MDKNALVGVYKAPDELMGVSIKSLLEEKGIKVILQSSQIPWYDSIMVSALGYWGEILVQREDEEKALTLIREFLDSVENE